MAEYAGIGTQLQAGDGASPEAFTTIAQLGDISGPNLTAGVYDTTTHDNTLQGYRDFITGLKDGGEVTAKLFFDANLNSHKDSGSGLMALFNANTIKNYRLIPAGYSSPQPKWSFSALVTKIGPFGYPVDGVQDATVTFKIKGKPVLA